MSKTVYKNLKNKLDELYKSNFAVKVGIYDDYDNLSQERLVPLGNYIYDPMPSNSEQKITQDLCSKIIK